MTALRPRLATDTAAIRRGRVLLGAMTEQEATAFLTAQAAEPLAALQPLWTTARSAFTAEPPFDGTPPTLEVLPADVLFELQALEQQPAFQAAFSEKPYRFQLVEIERLIAFQQFVDTEFSDGFAASALASATLLDRVRFCLPVAAEEQIAFSAEAGPTGVAGNAFSLSRNFQIGGLGFEPLQGDQPARIVIPVVMRGNWVQVREFEGRYFLANGYHRTWALYARGERFVPAVVTQAHTVEEIGAGPGFFPPALLLSERPPLFRHFFDAVLAPELDLKSMLKVIRVTGQEFLVPRVP